MYRLSKGSYETLYIAGKTKKNIKYNRNPSTATAIKDYKIFNKIRHKQN